MPQRLRKIHLLGASGSGTSTLGKAIAKQFSIPHFESDNFFWEATSPPYTTRMDSQKREALLRENTKQDSWVLSGSAIPWGDFLRGTYSLVIFLSLPQEVRIQRLREREAKNHGARIAPGGDMHKLHEGFIDWAKLYETGGVDVRSRALHEAWLRSIPCPVLRLSGLLSTEEQLGEVRKFLERKFNFQVTRLLGVAAAPIVDPFYEKLGRSARARPHDLFFVALENEQVLGTVRYCVEEGTPLLRGMLIAEEARKQGIGQALLKAFEAHLLAEGIGEVFCLPHGHLESFYGQIGFRKVDTAPAFLLDRKASYEREAMPDVIIMKRG